MKHEIERIVVYKVTNGEIFEDKEEALKEQAVIDREHEIRKLLDNEPSSYIENFIQIIGEYGKEIRKILNDTCYGETKEE